MATVSHTMDDGGDYEEVVDGRLSRGDVVKIKPGEAACATAPRQRRLVEQAQGSKTQIEALADYVARNFVAGVVAVAVAALLSGFRRDGGGARDWCGRTTARGTTSLMDQGHAVAMVGDGINDFAGAAAPI
ncbi:cation-transporting ATPase [Aureococcus anophagefferens]|nr:cation-transporting ATPase [Aureococcus anophagefferens]